METMRSVVAGIADRMPNDRATLLRIEYELPRTDGALHKIFSGGFMTAYAELVSKREPTVSNYVPESLMGKGRVFVVPHIPGFGETLDYTYKLIQECPAGEVFERVLTTVVSDSNKRYFEEFMESARVDGARILRETGITRISRRQLGEISEFFL